MAHTANTQSLDAAVEIADLIITRDLAIDSVLSDYDTAYDLLDPDDDTFAADVAALILTRDSDLRGALQTFDLTFAGDIPSKIFAENSDRQGVTVVNRADQELRLYIDTETVGALEALILQRNTDLFAALATYDAAVAALDPEDVDYETDLAALRTTRDAAVDTVTDAYDTDRATTDNNLVEYSYVTASGGRYDFPGVNWFDGPVWGAFASPGTGAAKITETRRR